MLKLYTVSVASVLATVLTASASDPKPIAPQLGSQQASEHLVTMSSPAIVGKYEVRNADRGMSKRVKVFYDGSRIATITLHRGEVTSHCCASEACEKVEDLKACTTLKISCGEDGNCSAK